MIITFWPLGVGLECNSIIGISFFVEVSNESLYGHDVLIGHESAHYPVKFQGAGGSNPLPMRGNDRPFW